MPKIINLSMADVLKGRFPDWANQNTILIQIQDVDNAPTAKFANVKRRSRFASVCQFRFDDVETTNTKHYTAITDDQAKSLANILNRAKQHDMNIVVHCHAGICRSGAVVEAAVQLGFDDPNVQRIPNLLVKNMILEKLGLGKNNDYFNEVWSQYD